MLVAGYQWATKVTSISRNVWERMSSTRTRIGNTALPSGVVDGVNDLFLRADQLTNVHQGGSCLHEDGQVGGRCVLSLSVVDARLPVPVRLYTALLCDSSSCIADAKKGLFQVGWLLCEGRGGYGIRQKE